MIYDSGISALEEKVKFLVETMEDNFIDIEELRVKFTEQMRNNARELEIPNWHELSYDTTEAWMILICNLSVHWAIRKNIQPDVFADHMNKVMQIFYSLDIAARLRQLYKGDGPKGDPLDDYRS